MNPTIEQNTNSDLVIIIPARNEEETLPNLLKEIFQSTTSQVIVVDNDSNDRTAEISKKSGALVVHEKNVGYGFACLAGIRSIYSLPTPPKFVCFIDGDGQSHVKDINRVLQPLINQKCDYCQGSRMKYHSSRNALSSAAKVANIFFTHILSFIWKQQITDLGPLRVISWDSLTFLDMQSRGFGWTIEMSVKILKSQMNHCEIPVRYTKRVSGQSKISGNIKSALWAAITMTLTLVYVMVFWRPSHAK
ncbi:MAG: glycosyltransferase family 2 protein [Candidatus Hodarchaeales archaeon]